MKFSSGQEINLQDITRAKTFLRNNKSLKNCTFQEVELIELDIDWSKFKVDNTSFLGCSLSAKDELILRKKGALIINQPTHLPFNPFRKNYITGKN